MLAVNSTSITSVPGLQQEPGTNCWQQLNIYVKLLLLKFRVKESTGHLMFISSAKLMDRLKAPWTTPSILLEVCTQPHSPSRLCPCCSHGSRPSPLLSWPPFLKPQKDWFALVSGQFSVATQTVSWVLVSALEMGERRGTAGARASVSDSNSH